MIVPTYLQETEISEYHRFFPWAQGLHRRPSNPYIHSQLRRSPDCGHFAAIDQNRHGFDGHATWHVDRTSHLVFSMPRWAFPIAYLADRISRKKIIIASLSLFSVMTFACGLAQNYIQLLLARIGVGIGEAGTNPPSHAIIADMYGPSERATPLTVFALGINLGLFVAFSRRRMD